MLVCVCVYSVCMFATFSCWYLKPFALFFFTTFLCSFSFVNNSWLSFDLLRYLTYLAIVFAIIAISKPPIQILYCNIDIISLYHFRFNINNFYLRTASISIFYTAQGIFYSLEISI